MSSFLPEDQRDRRNLSRQGEASHRRPHSFREQLQVEILERSFAAAGHGDRTLEDGLHIMIVVLVESTQLLWFLTTLQLSTPRDVAVRRLADLRRQCPSFDTEP